jgi:predicted nucleic acid-binding Zn finger protein
MLPEGLQGSLEALLDKLASMSEEDRIRSVRSLFGRRGRKAVEALIRGADVWAIEGREVYVISGEKTKYVLVGLKYCSCQDFYLNNVLRHRQLPCYHQLLLMLRLATGKPLRMINSSQLKDVLAEGAGLSGEE